MIKRKAELGTRTAPMADGLGEVKRTFLLTQEEMLNKGPLFNHLTIPVGASIGNHKHEGDLDAYYILKGRVLYNDNGTEVELGPGDLTLCKVGETHGLKVLGDEPVELIALMLFK